MERIHVPGVLDGPGSRALAEAVEFGWEGIVAKRRDSRYESGQRSRSWLKEKLLTTTDAVVRGWRPGRGGRSGSLGSLLLGLPAATGLTYIGREGAGLTDRRLDHDAGSRKYALSKATGSTWSAGTNSVTSIS